MNKKNIAYVITSAMFSLFLVSKTTAQIVKKGAEHYRSTDESFQQYKYPEWFRDAKFGIWAHWGPQAVPRFGDWYAKKMYMQGSDQNKYHIAHYGPPSQFGYKDIIPLWKAQNWNPDQLMKLYKKAGAKYFVSMGSHHDNFFLWNSKIHPWNSVNMGPHKDIVGLWQQAAKKEGLKFGVSEHLAVSFNWFQIAHSSDKTGPLAGVPYDGANPQYFGLYHQPSTDVTTWLTHNVAYQREWLANITELIDNYHPDLLYSDSVLPFGDVGREMLAHYYNDNLSVNGGQMEAVYTAKQSSGGKWVQDVERGVLDSISPFPWQTDTSIGDWFYKTGQQYKSSDDIAQILTDVVSKNGNLLINVVQTPEGDLEPDVLKIVEGMATWIAANGEGIYATRPWKIYGEGPSTIKANQQKGRYGGLADTHNYQPTDIRYTSKGNVIYAFCMARPTGMIRLSSLGKKSVLADKAVAAVTLLGSDERLIWTRQDDALVINEPRNLPAWQVTGFKIELKN